jgi:hypothetical protein
MPRGSIIITTRNRPHLLPRAVESARTSGADVEIVVVDDASTDETAQVCKTLSGINYIRIERNQRVAGARNVGLLASSGEYVSFLDDDDVRLAESLDLQIEMLEGERQAGLIYGRAFLDAQEGEAKHRSYPSECPQGDIFWQLLSRNFIPCGSAVFRRSCILRLGFLDDAIPGLDDWDLWVRIAEICPIIATESPVIIWRRSTPVSGQGTSRAARLVSLSVRQFREYWMKLPRAANASPKMRRAAWDGFSENMGEHLIWESARALRCRDTKQALRNLFTVLRLHPLTVPRIARNRLGSHSLRTKLGDSWSGTISGSDRVENQTGSKL